MPLSPQRAAVIAAVLVGGALLFAWILGGFSRTSSPINPAFRSGPDTRPPLSQPTTPDSVIDALVTETVPEEAWLGAESEDFFAELSADDESLTNLATAYEEIED